jgi:hypothetical protein
MSPSEFELMWFKKKNLEKDTAFTKAISVQERLALTLRFLASDDWYVSLQHLFKIFKQTISCIVLEVCEALVEKLKDYIWVRQILFVVYERSLKLDYNQIFCYNALGPILFIFFYKVQLILWHVPESIPFQNY